MASVRNSGGVALVLLAFLFFASPAWAQNEGCPNPRQVASFTGTEDRFTPDFRITGETFRLRYTIEDLDNSSGVNSFSIRVREDNQEIGQSVLEFEEGTYSENILAGPGTFDLAIESDDFRYTVFVDDCRGSQAKTKTKDKAKTKTDRAKDRRQERRRGFFFRQYQDDEGISQIEQYEDAEDDLDEDEEVTDADDFDNELGDDDGDGGVSATADENGAEASTPGAVASAGGDPDELAPETSVPGDVVDEVPTEGPLPNTGGTSLANGAMVVGMILLGTGLLTIRLAAIWRGRREG